MDHILDLGNNSFWVAHYNEKHRVRFMLMIFSRFLLKVLLSKCTIYTHKSDDDAFTQLFHLASDFITIARFFSAQSLQMSCPSPVLKDVKQTSGIPSSFKHFSFSSKSYLNNEIKVTKELSNDTLVNIHF